MIRLYGGKVGKNVYWDAITPTEFEMITVGDGSIIEMSDCVVHGVTGAKKSHVFTQDPLVIGANCCLNYGVCCLPPIRMSNNATLSTHCIVMKNDPIPENGYAIGNPARVVSDRALLYPAHRV